MHYYQVGAALDGFWATHPRWELAPQVYERMNETWGRSFWWEQGGLAYQQLIGDLHRFYEDACEAAGVPPEPNAPPDEFATRTPKTDKQRIADAVARAQARSTSGAWRTS